MINKEACLPKEKDAAGNWIVPPGCNVELDCARDYWGEAVAPQQFLQILRGDADAARVACESFGVSESFGGCNGKVLNSTSMDHVFVAFFDHGGTHIIGVSFFPFFLLLFD